MSDDEGRAEVVEALRQIALIAKTIRETPIAARWLNTAQKRQVMHVGLVAENIAGVVESRERLPA